MLCFVQWTPVNQGMHPGCNFGQYCDNFELHVIPGCGHCPHDEAPEKVHSIMMPWLTSTAAQYNPSQ
jgi:pimeloyl-ACP methyl ester carboxylesterase